jgi:cold shock protein
MHGRFRKYYVGRQDIWRNRVRIADPLAFTNGGCKNAGNSPQIGKSYMPTGKVRWFTVSKGFGFITPDDGSADVFLHLPKVEQAKLPTLESGTGLQFLSVKVFAKGLCVGSKSKAPRLEAGSNSASSDRIRERSFRRR